MELVIDWYESALIALNKTNTSTRTTNEMLLDILLYINCRAHRIISMHTYRVRPAKVPNHPCQSPEGMQNHHVVDQVSEKPQNTLKSRDVGHPLNLWHPTHSQRDARRPIVTFW